jgi:hypothetical protein
VAGAFAHCVPKRNLFLSPGHGILVSGRLIPAAYLVNGRTITQVSWSEVGYWHVELDQHDVLLAEGLPAESYLDCGNRADFENQTGPVTLHPLFTALHHEAACAPFVIAGPLLDEARATLDRRADALAAEAAGSSGRLIAFGRRMFRRRAG